MPMNLLAIVQTIGYCRLTMSAVMDEKRIKQMVYVSNSSIRMEPNTDFT